MADKKKEKTVKLNTDSFEAIEKITTGRTYGIDQTFLDDVDKEREKVKAAIRSVNDRQNNIVGDGIIEFFTAMIYNDNIDKNKSNKNKEESNSENQQRFSKILDGTNLAALSNIFDNERERILLYSEYEAVVNYIPQVYQALDAMADAILSPDDFSKRILNFRYLGSDSPSLDDHKKIIKNLTRLESNYKFEEKLKKIIFKSLYLGDSFVLVSSLRKEFNKILTEDSGILNESIKLEDTTFDIKPDEFSVIREMLLEEDHSKSSDKEKRKDIPSDRELKRDLLNMINNNVEFSTNSASIMELETNIAKEFKQTPVNTNLDSIINTNLKKNSEKNSSLLFTNVDDVEKTRYTSIGLGNTSNGLGTNKPQDIDIKGSYIKELEPSRIVKLRMGTTCFGYFYIETNLPDKSKDTMSFHASGRINDFRLKNTIDINSSNIEEELNNPKIKLITDIFGRALSTKVNKKFIEDNREFKIMMYELLKNDYITKKRVRIVFLSPDEVFHFRSDEADDGYGTSKLSKVLFTCKIYIATLVTNLMMKLSRSADHRAFYVETGLNKDVEGTIQAFIRDIKAREIRLNDLQTIDTIFRSIGQFHDYFIPQVNGSKPVEMDILQGQDVQMENDFMEYLRKAIISGLGVPSSFLQYADEVDFSRSLSMQNSRFLRGVIVMQKSYNSTLTDFYRKLYENEYYSETNKDNETSTVNLSNIDVVLPSPATLNMTNMADQISTISGVVDFIVQTIVGQNSDPADSDEIRRVVTKHYMTNIDWELIEGLIEDDKTNTLTANIIKNDNNDNNATY